LWQTGSSTAEYGGKMKKTRWFDVTWILWPFGVRKKFGRRILIKWIFSWKFPFVETFMRMEVPDGIQVIGFDQDDSVIVITETRKDTGERYTHLVGGTVDKGESHEETAQREFLEETGYRVGSITRLGSLKKDSAHLLGNTVLFMASECEKIREPESGVDVELMSLNEAQRTLYEYISNDPGKTRSGGNSVIALWLAKQRLATESR